MRVHLTAALTLLLVACAAQAAPVQAPTLCTSRGSSDRDIIAGTDGHDFICARAGDDYAHGAAGDDVVRGGSGKDSLVGGDGHDVVRGRRGPDKLFSIDQVHGNDLVVGGSGQDRCYVDERDRVRGCEKVYRPGSPIPYAAYHALERAFLGQGRLGQSFQELLGLLPANGCECGDEQGQEG